jgi:hypothetical protein
MRQSRQEEHMARALTFRPTAGRRLALVAHDQELVRLRRENEMLRRALETRKLVDRAKGLLMTRGLSEAEAFRHIQQTSMDTRTPMLEIARDLLRAVEAHQQASRAAEFPTGNPKASRQSAAEPTPRRRPRQARLVGG